MYQSGDYSSNNLIKKNKGVLPFKKRYFFLLIPIVLIVLFFLIPVFVRNFIYHKVEEFGKENQVMISIDKISFKHYSELIFENITVIQNHATDTFLHCNRLGITMDIFSGAKIKPHIREIISDNMKFIFVKNDHYCNYSFLKNKKRKITAKETDYPEKLNRYLTLFTDNFPSNFYANSIIIDTDLDSIKTDYQVDSLFIKEQNITGRLLINKDDSITVWDIRGNTDLKNKFFSGEILLLDKQNHSGKLPLLEELFSVQSSFDKLAFSLHVKEQRDDQAQFTIQGNIKKWALFHSQLSDQNINIDSAAFSLNISVSPKKIVLDSSSVMLLNGFTIHPYFLYERNKNKHIIFSVNEKNVDAAIFFKSLPKELFTVTSGLGVTGNMNFSFLFDCDYTNIDNLKFNFDISSKNLSFSRKMQKLFEVYNKPFEYIFYEDEIPIKKLVIGPENPDFCSFQEIPHFLTYAILASEDASFFKHKGFIKSSIRESMIANIKANRFIRGGSTISMQFVKNLFLNRKKNFARKFEEMLLVWLIESYELIPKERMFEIYVNLIEWGPCINGITPAAGFYFDKKPQELTFGECVYLASLIRSPKLYAYTLDNLGEASNARKSEMRYVAKRMLEREMITEIEYQIFNANVRTSITPEKLEETIKVCEEKREKYQKEQERKRRRARMQAEE